MIQCESCRRHHRLTDDACPFCHRSISPVVRAMNLLGGAVTTVILAACYGTYDKGTPYDSGSGETGTTTDQITPPESGESGESGAGTAETGGTGATGGSGA